MWIKPSDAILIAQTRNLTPLFPSGTYNVNTGTYAGPGTGNTLLMTNLTDYFNIDLGGTQTISDVQRIVTGNLPEPAGMMLLIVGGAGLERRRKYESPEANCSKEKNLRFQTSHPFRPPIIEAVADPAPRQDQR